MVDDVTVPLLAAIDRAEEATIRYRDGHEGPCLNHEGQDPEAYDEWHSCYLHIATAEASPYRDVAFGLRRCEADRRIIRHFLAVESLVDDPNVPMSPAGLTALRPVINRLVGIYRLDAEEVDDECE